MKKIKTEVLKKDATAAARNIIKEGSNVSLIYIFKTEKKVFTSYILKSFEDKVELNNSLPNFTINPNSELFEIPMWNWSLKKLSDYIFKAMKLLSEKRGN